MKKNRYLQKTIKRLVDLSFRDGKILESQVVKSVNLLKELKGAERIESLSEYLNQLKRRERQFTMLIETSIPIPPDLIRKVKKIVEKKHKITKVINSVNPQILGGFKLKIGDEVWDETVSDKMRQIKEALIS